MAYYLVKAEIDENLKPELKEMLDDGEIKVMKPFGNALHFSLTNARVTDDNQIIWEEEDYCSPPLAMEREAVLDKYFNDLDIERVEKGEGWSKIDNRPFLWESKEK
ncbi:MAG: hypothetical protein GWN61_23150 [candidate division Zixibacteria bacterium]|nr:hypothetical protein [candidate division Zixibacteria bacterium]NIW49857.1 hypothetical protein [Gammaproteobacteria bacterium]NIR67421.1 hypothetical protein [candidate division Zixibacteria bacterium]NIS48761.1 hypothetical protein [candidate division Zixibacteria bacterium]NIU16827.1 hypothetical protein [candidate division Zixibacteria bacterium]